MAIMYMDGFDVYGTSGVNADEALAAAGFASSSGISMSNATRTGRGLCTMQSSGFAAQQSSFFSKAFETVDGVIVGVAFKGINTALTRIMELRYDNRYGTIYSHICVYRNAQGGITIGQSTGSNEAFFAASGPNIIFPNVWQYVEVKFKPGGELVVRVDGATVLAVSGAKNSAAPNLVNMVRFLCGSDEASLNPGSTKWFDDLYICNYAGSVFNNFCGDVVVHGLMPNGDYGPNDMARFGGGLANYTAVDDVPPDEDISYVYSNTAGHEERYTVDPLPANIIDVLAVSVHARAKKDAPGLSRVKVKVQVNSDVAQSDDMTLTTVYTNKHHIFEQAPDGGGWNKSKASNMKIGFEIV